MKENPNVIRSVTITISKKMPRSKRVSEVSKQISEWLESLEKPFNYRTNSLRMEKFEQSNNEYILHYEIHRKVEDLNNHGKRPRTEYH